MARRGVTTVIGLLVAALRIQRLGDHDPAPHRVRDLSGDLVRSEARATCVCPAGVDERALCATGDLGFVEHQQHRGGLGRGHGRRVVAAVSQQLGAPGVRGPLGAEREIGDRRQSCFLSHHYLEGAAPVAATRPEQLAREE